MTPFAALTWSFLFGLLHGALPDEHTWPITFSYAVGGMSGRQGLKAGLYFSAAFTVQRMIISELACLALTPALNTPLTNGIANVVVGGAMVLAGALTMRSGRYAHFHLVGHHHAGTREYEMTPGLLTRHHAPAGEAAEPGVPLHWTLIHGFIAGFAFGGFSLFVNAVAAPAMPSGWLGFAPGLFFGLGTMVMLASLGALFGASTRWIRGLNQAELMQLGARAGGRMLLFGGLLFAIAGTAGLLGFGSRGRMSAEYALIGVFVIAIALPSFAYSYSEVIGRKKAGNEPAV